MRNPHRARQIRHRGKKEFPDIKKSAVIMDFSFIDIPKKVQAAFYVAPITSVYETIVTAINNSTQNFFLSNSHTVKLLTDMPAAASNSVISNINL